MIIRLMLSSNDKIYKRSIYTILDVIGDIGGLLDGLKALGSIIISI